jgi:hypothetical protein
MNERRAELRYRIKQLKDQISSSAWIAEIFSPIIEEILPLAKGRIQNLPLQDQLAEAERQLAILESSVIQSGLSEDGRTYFTPDGPVQLSARGAEVMGIIVAQWERGVKCVPIDFIKEKIGGSDGDTRIRDYVGRAEYQRLLRSGEKRGTKGTVELMYPPKNPR